VVATTDPPEKVLLGDFANLVYLIQKELDQEGKLDVSISINLAVSGFAPATSGTKTYKVYLDGANTTPAYSGSFSYYSDVQVFSAYVPYFGGTHTITRLDIDIAGTSGGCSSGSISYSCATLNKALASGQSMDINYTGAASGLCGNGATVLTFSPHNISPLVPGMGLVYFGARYYDPEIGVWISTDPDEQFWNSYSYCGGNPIVLVDPLGLSAITDRNAYVNSLQDIYDATGQTDANFGVSAAANQAVATGGNAAGIYAQSVSTFNFAHGWGGQYFPSVAMLEQNMENSWSKTEIEIMSGFADQSLSPSFRGNTPIAMAAYWDRMNSGTTRTDWQYACAPQIIGGILGAAYVGLDDDLIYQLVSGQISGWEYAGKVGFGALTGVAGSFGAGWAGTAIRGIYTSADSDAFEQLTSTNEKYNANKTIAKAIIGGGIATGAFWAGKVSGKYLGIYTGGNNPSLSKPIWIEWTSFELPGGTIGDVSANALVNSAEKKAKK
jgi:RHS repeat-associated protein